MHKISKLELEQLYLKSIMTDKDIGLLKGCHENTVRAIRRAYGIKTNDRSNIKRAYINSLSNGELREIIRNNNYQNIQKILGVSCKVWKEELKVRGMESKSVDRITKYPELTYEQIKLIIGSLLGDGGLERSGECCDRYFECHAPNQTLYLKKKHNILKPFSTDIYIDKAYDDLFCYRFSTISHLCFRKFMKVFYEEGLEGKLIPIDFIKSYWHDDILAYWFLDDGHFDEKSGCYTIANKCPKPEQLFEFLDFLSDYYKVPFSYYTEPDLFSIKIPLVFRERFIQIILNVATEDMLYKVPAKYRRIYKMEINPQEPSVSPRITDIKNKIVLGYTLEDLQKEYPITEALFIKLGGKINKYININHPLIYDITGDDLKSEQIMPLDTAVIIGTLLGDGNIFKYGDNTCVFSFAHSEPQIGYVKLKYELLKSYVNRIRYLKNTTNKYYSFHVLLKSLPIFSEYNELFYTAIKEGKKNPQKYLFRDEIIDLINLRTFAFWLMDDGKKYGSGKYMFSITIGKQPYYNYDKFNDFVGKLNDKLGLDMRAREEKISYEITTASDKVEETYYKLKDYIWPYFSYKFAVAQSDCGSIYTTLPWFLEWSKKDAYLCNL
jgi:hypothetical protein